MATASPSRQKSFKRITSLLGVFLLLVSAVTPTVSQRRISGSGIVVSAKAGKARKNVRRAARANDEKEIRAERLTVPQASVKATSDLMEEGLFRRDEKSAREILRESGVRRQKVRPDRRNLPDGSEGSQYNRFPYPTEPDLADVPVPDAPQTIGLSFDGATGPIETNAFPPDTMGAVGPTQFFVFLNGRLRTFSKTTGVADGVINVDSDVFFASVTTPPVAGTVTFTTDPMIRYDRLTGRWFLNMIDVSVSTTTGAITVPNRIMIAVSNAGSETITGATTWAFYQFQGDPTLFTDYQSFGIDSSAMYIGGNMFTLAGTFNSTKGFVIPKAPALTGSALTVWSFAGMVPSSSAAGPFAPRGVDNYQVAPTTEGYFIGVDNATFNTLMIRRITNPGSLGPAPTISANISVATPLTTRFPLTVNHLGDTGGTNGNLDALDDRLFAAHLRNGRLWTAHSVGVNNTGVSGATNNRNAARWYELQNLGSTPSVVQSGTLYDNNATNDANQRNYWIPSVMVSGQGHMALGSSIAGTNERINAFTTGRLAGDALGTLRDGPGGAALPGYTASTTAYNPPGDPGPPRRWGDYSYTSLDPLDDMTMWTIQQYCNGTNTYGVRIAKLVAPPPPNDLVPSPGSIAVNTPSHDVVVTGTAGGSAGRGFYDPGADPAAPHTPFTNLSASGVGVTVNSITYNTPTQVTVNLSSVGSTLGTKTVTITNPDGQATTFQIQVTSPTAAPAALGGRIVDAGGRGVNRVLIFATGADGSLRTALTNAFGYYLFSDLPTGQSYVISASHRRYEFSPASIAYTHSAEFGELNFDAQPH